MDNQGTASFESGAGTATRSIFVLCCALIFMLAPVAQAVPMTVDIYGAPYFSIAGWGDQAKPGNQWVTLERNQGLNVVLEDDQLSMVGRHDLSTHDRSEQYNQFSFLNMRINLPGSTDGDFGFVDYLMGDQSGQFTLQQVVYRTPVGANNPMLSLFFWGFDYANGAGLVLGLDAVAPPNDTNVVAQVKEPSMVFLLLMGLGAFRLSRARIHAKY